MISKIVYIKKLLILGYSMEDVIFSVQNEIKSLLFEYLTNTENLSILNGSVLSIKDVIKDKKQKIAAPEKIKKVRFEPF